MARGAVSDTRTTGFARLPSSHWTHLRCAPRGTAAPAPPDEVLVGPSGVYAIVRRAGTLEIDLTAARSAAAAVALLLPERYRDRVVPVVCMHDDDPVAERRAGVLVTGASTLEHVVRSSPPVLSTSEVRGLGSRLAGPARAAARRPAPTAPPAAAAGRAGVRRRDRCAGLHPVGRGHLAAGAAGNRPLRLSARPRRAIPSVVVGSTAAPAAPG